MTRYIAGIDPGKNGGIVFMMDGKITETHAMPEVSGELDIQILVNILSSYVKPLWETHVFIEDVHAIFGSAAGATFSFGFVCGAIQATVSALQMPFTLVQPKVWQKVAYQGIPEIRKPDIVIKKGKRAGKTMQGKRDCKKMSELAARRLFPGVDFRASERCKKIHDGLVDAALIAYYGGYQKQNVIERKKAMKYSNYKFWIVIGFWLVGLVLIFTFNGCDLKATAQGRFITRILAFSVGDNHCETATTGEYGVPTYAEAHERAIAYVNDVPLEEPGLHPQLAYSHLTQWPGGNSYSGSTVIIEADKVTGDDGSILIKYKNSEWWPSVSRRGSTTIGYTNRHIAIEPAHSGAVFYNPRCYNYEALVPWTLPANSICPRCKCHYAYGGYISSGSICGSRWVQPTGNALLKSQSVNNQSKAEIDFISVASDLPDTGYALKQAVWLKQMGENWVKPVEFVVPVDYPDADTEPNRTFNEMVRDWAHPYYVSFLFVTAETIDIEGMRLIAKVSCNGKSGIISASITESSPDGTRHIARTGGILPMDKEIEPAVYQVNPRWRTVDPNVTEDILVIEMPPNEPLEVECDVSAECIAYAVPYWLSGNKTMDLNGDGVVNLTDIERIQ